MTHNRFFQAALPAIALAAAIIFLANVRGLDEGDDGLVCAHVLAWKNGCSKLVPPYRYAANAGLYSVLYAANYLPVPLAKSFALLSGIGGLLFILFSLSLAAALIREYGKIAGETPPLVNCMFYCIALFSVPECLHSSLYGNSNIVSLAIAMGSLLLLYTRCISKDTGSSFTAYFLSAALFAFAVTVRADVSFMGIPIITLMLVAGRPRSAKARLLLLWCALAITFWIVLIRLLDVNPLSILRHSYGHEKTVKGMEYSRQKMAGSFFVFLYPNILVLSFAACILMFIRKLRELPLVALSFVVPVFAFWIPRLTTPKYLLLAAPGIYICVLYVLQLSAEKLLAGGRKKRTAPRLLLFSFIVFFSVIHLFIGVRLAWPGKPYRGEGFEKAWAHDGSMHRSISVARTPTITIHGLKAALCCGAGWAVPTDDGERGLGGVLFILLRENRRLAEERMREREFALIRALESRLPIYPGRDRGIFDAMLLDKGFIPQDHVYNDITVWKNKAGEEFLVIMGYRQDVYRRAAHKTAGLPPRFIAFVWHRLVDNIIDAFGRENIERLSYCTFIINAEKAGPPKAEKRG